MRLLPKQKKHSTSKHVTKIGFLPETKKISGVRLVKHATATSSKVEAKQKAQTLRKNGRLARIVKTEYGWVIYSRAKNV